MKKLPIINTVLIILSLIAVIVFNNNNDISGKLITEELRVEEAIVLEDRGSLYEDSSFTPEVFKQYLKEINLKYPDIVMAQAIIESGNFKSKLFINHHNPFGMMIAKQRPTLAKKGAYPYASYKNWKHAVMDYAYYESRYMNGIKSKEDYLNKLGKVYAEDPNYISKLKKIIKNNE